MRSMKLVAAIARLATGMVYAQSQIDYVVETGGNNNVAAWESQASPMPFFTSGVTDGSTTVNAGEDLTWAVRVEVSGAQSGGGPGDGLPTAGAANLVFDLQLFQADGTTPVAGFGAAPLSCTTGTPGAASSKGCKPSAGGFWSSINDGDTDGNGGQIIDVLANAAFAVGIWGNGYDPAPGATDQLYRLIDPAGPDPLNAPQGPNFDYGWYPTANSRGGVDTEGSKPINTNVTTVESKLVGFGAGYKSFEAATHRAGVGIDDLSFLYYGYGAGRPLFEGQINTAGLAGGTYVLKVVPSADGNNVIHGQVDWGSATPNYGGFGSFAVKANAVVGSQVSFTVVQGTEVKGRFIYYNNSYFDGNKVAIDAAPLAGANNDDADAIDTSKVALLPGGGRSSFANWTGFDKGINGLIYDIKSPAHTPVIGDFEFVNQGKAGTGTAVVNTGTLVVWPGLGVSGADRCVISFPDNAIKEAWLKVTVKTSIGLSAADVSYWGNAPGDGGTGNTDPNIIVGSTDEIAARNNPHNSFNRAKVWDEYDYNKTSIVDATDQIYARNNPRNSFNCVKFITR